MPELPEVETTCRGIAPHILGQQVAAVVVRNPKLRWPVPAELALELPGRCVERVERRGKYLLLYAGDACLLVHLGMSGSLRVTSTQDALLKHDHIDIVMGSGAVLRYSDPRRFGCMLWLKESPFEHLLLKTLGPEPLTDEFSGRLLYTGSRGRKVPVKSFIMDSHVVVGVGNIYANEALFMAGIRPNRAAGRVSAERYERLASCIKEILARAITQGGTTLRDFVGGDGKPGYFKQSLHVYGRGGDACTTCGEVLQEIRLGQRSTVFCPHCQH
ncbi:MAG: bifunctional DNA-formamidopyrimidine glycosylase/DNA-(apurinic or apyrimidinic site) lyase [Pseudomonadota bacterium]